MSINTDDQGRIPFSPSMPDVLDHWRAGQKLPPDFVSQTKAAVVPKVCSSQMKKMLELGASYEFEYQDKDRYPLGYVIVSSADCR